MREGSFFLSKQGTAAGYDVDPERLAHLYEDANGVHLPLDALRRGGHVVGQLHGAGGTEGWNATKWRRTALRFLLLALSFCQAPRRSSGL